VTEGRRPVIVAPYLALSSFVVQDFETLRQDYDLRLVDCRSPAGMARAAALVRRAQGVFCWFGSTRFLPVVAAARAWGKPVVIVTGGYDVTSLPEIGYGNMRHPLGRFLGRLVFRAADRVACISRSVQSELERNVGLPASRVRLIPLGFDDIAGGGVPASAKEPVVLTVARVDASTVHRKGLLTVARVSRVLPEVRFVLAGSYEEEALAMLRQAGGPNLECLGYLSDAELRQWYRRARVYLQPSLHEGFGCSIAEAMLFECLPIVTRRFSIPELVGRAGVYVEPGDVEGIAAAVRAALRGEVVLEESPRARILAEFPAVRRRTGLRALLRELPGLGEAPVEVLASPGAEYSA